MPPVSDGAAAVVLATGDKAREVCEPAGVDRGLRPPGRAAPPGHPRPHGVVVDGGGGEKAPASGEGIVEVAELTASFTPEELILREALGLDGSTR